MTLSSLNNVARQIKKLSNGEIDVKDYLMFVTYRCSTTFELKYCFPTSHVVFIKIEKDRCAYIQIEIASDDVIMTEPENIRLIQSNFSDYKSRKDLFEQIEKSNGLSAGTILMFDTFYDKP
jgi:hypothetical protein